jgi:hypothetical protein
LILCTGDTIHIAPYVSVRINSLFKPLAGLKTTKKEHQVEKKRFYIWEA